MVIVFLAEERDRQIASGEVDIGRRVVPVTSQRRRNGETIEDVVFGRAISLQTIRQQHLYSMLARGILRQTNTADFTVEQCRQFLNQHDGSSSYKAIMHCCC